ncbi:hypothetical protein [Alteribacter natronophilus]|uniref:hypothetical protein n=1 Tax=Alteribacter natronophilus TaxID=2583810 RepID=UPI00110DA74E|nr:hypothetical protein [Alteribacter natronophilus]TMW73628.1 hypothetical protein FGB90_04835 [Alteribacter natronophilus]
MKGRHLFYMYLGGLFLSIHGLRFFSSQPFGDTGSLTASLVFSPFSWFTAILTFTGGFFLLSRIIKGSIEGFVHGQGIRRFAAVFFTCSALTAFFGWAALLLTVLAFLYGIMDAVDSTFHSESE